MIRNTRETVWGRARTLSWVLLIPILGATLLLGACEEYLTELPPEASPPVVTGFTLEPAILNVAGADLELNGILGLRSVEPVDSVALRLGLDGEELVCSAVTPESGDERSGDWRCSATFSTDASTGYWTVLSLSIYPSSGESVVIGTDDLEEAGYPHEVWVVRITSLVIDAGPAGLNLREVDDTVRLSAAALEESGDTVPGIEISWSSSDTTVAVVDADGLVRATGEGGAVISAFGAGLRAAVQLTVGEGLDSPIRFLGVFPDTINLGPVPGRLIAFTPPSLFVFTDPELPMPDSIRAQLTRLDERVSFPCAGSQIIDPREVSAFNEAERRLGPLVPEGALTWVCTFTFGIPFVSGSIDGDPDIPELTHDLLPDSLWLGDWEVSEVEIGRGREWEEYGDEDLAALGFDRAVAVIRAAEELGPVAFIALDPWSHTFEAIGDTIRIMAYPMDEMERLIAEAPLVWSTSDESVATVDEAGLVTAVGPGTAIIRVESGDVSAEAEIVVELRDEGEYWSGWVAAGSSWSSQEYIATSADGKSWRGGEGPFGSGGAIFDIASNGERWIAVGQGSGAVATSVDAVNWRVLDTPFDYGESVVWVDGRWFVSGMTEAEDGPRLITSEDGEDWSIVEIPELNVVYRIGYNGELWVAVGDGIDPILTSTDGRSWTPRESDLFFGVDLAWDGELWVAVGGDRVVTSSDGLSWTRRDVPITDFIQGVATSGGTWVITGTSSSDGPPHIAISADGIDWREVPSPFSTGAGAISWNGEHWLAGSGSGVALSRDGMGWETHSISAIDGINQLGWGGRPINEAPRVELLSPSRDTVIAEGDEIHLRAGGISDAEDGDLPSSAVIWASDLDGELGRGAELTYSELSSGRHTITLTVSDSHGAITRRWVVVEVEGAAVPKIFEIGRTPDEINIDEIYEDGALTVWVIPASGSVELDSIEVVLTGPSGQSHGCEISTAVDRSEFEGTGIPLPDPGTAPDPWLCGITFGLEATLEEGLVYPLDEEVLEAIEEGVWEVTEVHLGHAGNWHILDAEYLVEAEYELDVLVERMGETIAWISVEPWNPYVTGLGNSVQIEAVAYGMYENRISGVQFSYRSLDPEIATVDEDGVVTGHTMGKARIEISARDVTDEIPFHVFDVGDPIRWDTVVAGYDHACGLSGWVAYCWGDNQYGQLGTDLDIDFSPVPIPVAGGQLFSSLSLGHGYTVGLLHSGAAYAWGWNRYGQLGDGTDVDHSIPVPVAGDHRFSQVSAGGNHVVALSRVGDHLYSWGYNGNGELGNGTSGVPQSTPVEVRDAGGDPVTFDAISAGGSHTLALRDGVLYAWGRNHQAQLGDGTSATRNRPVEIVVEGATFTQISADYVHSLALTDDGRVFGWGYALYSSPLRDGRQAIARPSEIDTGETIASIATGGNGSWVITADGNAYTWGRNWYGELGVGDSPVGEGILPVVGGHRFLLIDGGDTFTVGLTEDGRIFGWGYNYFGSVGDGTLDDRTEPTPIVGPGTPGVIVH